MRSADPALRFGCGRCARLPSEHLVGRCPDGGGTYTFAPSAEAFAWLRDNPDVPGNQLASRYAEHLRRRQALREENAVRAHGEVPVVEVPAGEVLGACPACSAELRVGDLLNPLSGCVERSLLHPVPFCTYFGETDSSKIVAAVRSRGRTS
jgi:hypothetical protein